MINSNAKTNTSTKTHHYLRTPLAALFGFIAVNLILASIFTVWLNKTLTDTPTFVNTVAPLIEKPEVQQFVASNAAENILKSVPVQDIAPKVLPQAQLAGKTQEQLQPLVQKEVENRILKVVSEPSFAATWRTNLESTHSTVTTQLESGAENITFDLSPVIKQAVDQLAKTDLGIDTKEMELGNGAGKINLKRSDLGPVTDAYDSIQSGTIALLIAAAVCAAACIILSVHHMKTLRRVLAFTGVFSLIIFIILNLPSYVTTTGIEATDKAAVTTIIDAIFADLKISYLIVAITSFAVAVGSKLFDAVRSKKLA